MRHCKKPLREYISSVTDVAEKKVGSVRLIIIISFAFTILPS